MTLIPRDEWQTKFQLVDPHPPAPRVYGMLYKVADENIDHVIRQLDHREKNGYDMHKTRVYGLDGGVLVEDAVLYIATTSNDSFLGPIVGDDGVECVAQHIAASVGPSGRNSDYLLQLAEALRLITTDTDHHIADLEQRVKQIMK